MRNILCSILLMAMICPASYGQKNTGAIKGKVFTADGKPAAAVSIHFKKPDKYVITSDDGSFSILKLEEGSYELEISMVGFETVDKKVAVEKDKSSTIEVNLPATQQQLSEVIVTTLSRPYTSDKPSESLRLTASLMETPQNITVTTTQTIKDMGLLSIGEILRTSSGVIKSGAQNDISVSIRGTNATYNMFRNGVGGGGYWYNMNEDAAMIERVEFVKGPAGFMVANAEPGGTVNIVTKQPTHERIASIGFTLGSWNLMRTNVDLGGELSKGGPVTYRFNAGFQQQGQMYQFGKFKDYFITGAVKYELNERTSITAEYNQMYGNSLSNGNTIPTVNGKFFALPSNLGVVDPNVEGVKSGDKYARIHLKHKLDDNWNLNAQSSYVWGYWGGNMMFSDGGVVNDTLYRYPWRTNWKNSLLSAQAFVDGKFYTGRDIEHKVLLGIDYGNVETSSAYGGDWATKKYGLYLPKPVYYLNRAELKDITMNPEDISIWGSRWSALYVQDHIKFFNKVVVTVAGRYTHNDTWANYNDPQEQGDNKFTPRAGLTYLLAENMSAYAVYDQSFMPQSGRLFNTEILIKPFTGSNKEIGFKGNFFHKKLYTSISVYHLTKNNVMISDPEHPGFYLQKGQIVSKGVEFDISGNLTKQLTVMGNYAYADAKITKDIDPTTVGLRNQGTPDHYGNVFLKYRIQSGAVKGLSFSTGAQYMGKRNATYSGTVKDMRFMPTYSLLEAAVGYSTSKFQVNLNVYNITNKKYVSSAYTLDDVDWGYTPGEPINFRLDFAVRL